ncbi:putative zinc-binding metallopeptidase [uncultured Abyssibacter sp.]|uniref:zinc-binding metallopeptidase family protein n=1 Tax=uncultured Abyssibacter sp. TaxID=2320202 RepID=UPI0032B23537
MQTFHCVCGNTIFFKNTRCEACERRLAFLPDERRMSAVESVGGGRWKSPEGRQYRRCRNYRKYDICNWMVPAEDPNPHCLSCRLTEHAPDLNDPRQSLYVYRLESAKRHLLYTILQLGLPVRTKAEDPEWGLAFRFETDRDPDTEFVHPVEDAEAVWTGHANGTITINLAEADHVARERMRVQMKERYRTLLGHFRHEIGHYYWALLVDGTDMHARYRDLFGDERQDYAKVLQRYYKRGAPRDWNERFISPYASSHPWEDWAESFAHYLHMIDTLGTANDFGFVVQGRQIPPAPYPDAVLAADTPFDEILDLFVHLSIGLNAISRSMGVADLYPFVLCAPAKEKLRFVHEVIHARSSHRGVDQMSLFDARNARDQAISAAET